MNARLKSEIWPIMHGDKKEGVGASSIEPVCGKLRALFDDVTRTPMPDQLELLAEQLDAALERGELTGRKIR